MKENKILVAVVTTIIVICAFYLRISVVDQDKGKAASAARDEIIVQQVAGSKTDKEITNSSEKEIVVKPDVEQKFEYANECSSKFYSNYISSYTRGTKSKKEFSVTCKCKKNLGGNNVMYASETFYIEDIETVKDKTCVSLCTTLCPTMVD